ncbi:MAG: hypothetical protein ABWZ82_11165 [Candidatus Limnocylindrales bacterium]
MALIGMLAAVSLVGSAYPALAASSGVTDRETLVSSLLQAEDIATYDPSGEAQDISADDVPEFAANDGIREVARTWFDMDRMSVIYDFRFQFPDEASALAFLDDAQDGLGEVHNGSQREDPPVAPLPDTRYYLFHDIALGTKTDGHAFLMHHGNIAAKVWISGVDGNVSPTDAGAIATAAAARMQQAVGDDVEPLPSQPSGDGPVAELMSHIPAGLASDCEVDGDEPDADAGELARVVCTPSAEASILFILYDGEASLDAAFDISSTVAGIIGWEPADSCEAGGYEGTWRLGEETAGRLLCAGLMGTATITWSHPETRILATIRQSDGDPAAAYQVWLGAGPE